MENNFIITDIKRVIYIDKSEYSEKTTSFSSKQLFSHELIYHFSGEMTVYYNNEILKTSPNTIRYLPMGYCQKYVVDREQHGDCIDIFFKSNIPLSDKAFVRSVKNEKIGTLFRKIFLIWTQKDEEYYLEALSLLYKIIAEMQKTDYLPNAQYEKIIPAINFIHDNFLKENEITAEKLVQVCGISYSYIKRLFVLKFKISPKKYIISLKMNYACDLLRSNMYNISQIAEICGYSDIYTFSHQFKKTFSISPSNFIKKYKSSR